MMLARRRSVAVTDWPPPKFAILLEDVLGVQQPADMAEPEAAADPRSPPSADGDAVVLDGARRNRKHRRLGQRRRRPLPRRPHPFYAEKGRNVGGAARQKTARPDPNQFPGISSSS
jgi:hypothetical protein